MISVLILTLDEEVNILDCIQSLPDAWRKDIVILDSESQDGTRELAEKAGARVITRPFANYADQRNFGLSQDFAYEWILMIDADERVTPELAQEIERIFAGSPSNISMYRCRRKDMFMARWLKRSSGYPTFFPRLFRKGSVRVEREVNEEYHCDGEVGQLAGHLLHYPFNKGLDWWYQRHARYASMEARKLLAERDGRTLRFADVVSSDPARRRAALKQIAYRLPGRPMLVFLYLYVFRAGFLDGVPGYHYAAMRASYEIMIDSMQASIRYGEQI